MVAVVENDRSCRLFATYKEKHVIPSQELSGACGSSNNPRSLRRRKVSGSRSAALKSDPRDLRWEVESSRCSASSSQGIIVDRLARKNVTICEGGLTATNDERGLYLSTGNLLDVILYHSRNPTRKFVLKIEGESAVCRIISATSEFHRAIVLQQLDT